MLDTYHAIAKRIHRVRWLLWALAVGAGLAFLIGLLVVSGTAYFLVSIVVLLWALLMLATAQSFVRPVPEVDPEAGFLARLRARFWRGYLWLLAVATTLLGLFVVYVSIRALTMIARGDVA